MQRMIAWASERLDAQSADMLMAVLAGALFSSPVIGDYLTVPLPTWNAWLLGLTILMTVIAGRQLAAAWPNYLLAGSGVWLMISPWLLQFHDNIAAWLSHEIVGLLVTIIAVLRLLRMDRDTSSRAAA
jgi:hypothetical protein